MALPKTGGITTLIKRSVVIFRNLLASQPVNMIVAIEITDAGSVTNVDCKLLKPKAVNARLPKLPVPPFGI
jgi:hypothetical protein